MERSNEQERIKNLSNRSRPFSFVDWYKSGAKSGVLTTRIYNYPAQQAPSGAVFPGSGSAVVTLRAEQLILRRDVIHIVDGIGQRKEEQGTGEGQASEAKEQNPK